MSLAATVRSFIDLRAFAQDAGAATDLRDTGRGLPLGDGPVGVSALRLSGGGRIMAMPADLFVILLSGELAIDGVAVPAGRSIVLPAGTGFTWQAVADSVAITMRCTRGAGGADRPVPIDEAATLTPSGAPLADLLVGPTPECRNHTDYRSANGEFLCGTWDSTPYHRLPMRYRHHELMHLLAGSVTFVDETGRRATFGRGDIFLVERGAECSWESTVFVKKVYAIHRPAD